MLRSRLKAHVITPDWSYQAHTMAVEEFTDTPLQRVTVSNGDVDLVVMTDATVTTRDGENWRAEGLVDGQPAIWTARKACGRCGSTTVYPTPAYDVPQ